MNIKFVQNKKIDLKNDAVFICGFQNKSFSKKEVPSSILKNSELFLKNNKFKFDGNKHILFANVLSKSILDVIFFGFGKLKKTDSKKMFLYGCKISSLIKKKYKNISIILPPEKLDNNLYQVFLRGININLYKFKKYTKKNIPQKLTINIIFNKNISKNILSDSNNISSSINIIRDLINEPPSVMNPDEFVKKTKSIAKENNLSIKVMRKKDLIRLKCSGLLNVSSGSFIEPALIRLEYKPKKYTKSIYLVGKGITFDSGGLSLKTGTGMMTMKCDMSGAAAVLGCLISTAKLHLPVRVIGYMAIAENLPDSRSYKPGDIIKFGNKKTVEVLNTDAEGRLVLADALIRCEKEKAKTIIDFATLTGACMVGLGHHYAGAFSNNKKLLDKIIISSEKSGERIWPMPTDEVYRDELKSNIADMKNIGSSYGGAITAALFLKEFIDKADWLHLDIAGPAYYDKKSPEGIEGATGFGIATIIEFLKKEA